MYNNINEKKYSNTIISLMLGVNINNAKIISYKIIKVIDGDTVYIDFNDNGIPEQDEKVRINGIDTFETKLNDGLNWQMKLYNLTQDEARGLGYYGKEFTKKYNEIIEKDNKNKPKNIQIKLLPHINPHAFRHSQASILLKSGVNIADISTNLGHSNLTTILNIYSHVLEKANKRVSNTLENVLLNKDEIKSSIVN